jgi:hypothetical protein
LSENIAGKDGDFVSLGQALERLVRESISETPFSKMQGTLLKRFIVFGANESSFALLSIIDERIISSSDWTRMTLPMPAFPA